MHTVRVDLPFTLPFFPDNLYGHLVATAVPGVEEWRDGAYRRTLRLPGGPGIVTLPVPADDEAHVAATLHLTDPRDEPLAVALCRRILDLDADPALVDGHLRRDPVLAPLVTRAPGRRVPGCPDATEFAVRAVLGQQVSTAAARTHAGRLVAAHGEAVADPAGGLTQLFPTPEALRALDEEALALPASRRRTLVGLVEALASGQVRLGGSGDSDPDDCRAGLDALADLPGIGPWTVESVAMRALGDPDAFLSGDLGVAVAAKGLRLPSTPGALTAHAEAWRPYRAYAVQHLWATGAHAVNLLPA